MQRSKEQAQYMTNLQPSYHDQSDQMQPNYNSLMYSNLDHHVQGQRKIVPIFPIGLTSQKASHQITVDGFGGKLFCCVNYLSLD